MSGAQMMSGGDAVIRSLLVQLGYDLAPEEVMRRLAAVRASPDHAVLAGILVFSMRGEKIQSVHVIADPRQLSFVSSQLG